MEQLRAIWCCASPNADSRRTSRILRMDNLSSGKSDSPCFKQNQIALFDVQRRPFLCSDPIAITHSELIAISRSELPRFPDRHRLGTDNRDHLGTMIFISSEW